MWMKTLRIIDRLRRCVSLLFTKLFRFASMRNAISRVVSRALLGWRSGGPRMEPQRDAHPGAQRRRMVRLSTVTLGGLGCII